MRRVCGDLVLALLGCLSCACSLVDPIEDGYKLSPATTGSQGVGGDGAGGAAGTGGSNGGSPAQGGGGAASLAPCPSSPLQDDFDDGTVSAAWDQNAAAGSIDESGGQLHVTLGSGGGNRWVEVLSSQAYDLDGCGLFIRYTSPPLALGERVYVLVTNALGSPDYADFYQVGSELQAFTSIGGTTTVEASVPQSPATPTWLWLRTADGQLEWYTSSDGVSWMLVHQMPTFLDATSLYVALGVGVVAGQTSAGFSVAFDDLDMLP